MDEGDPQQNGQEVELTYSRERCRAALSIGRVVTWDYDIASNRIWIDPWFWEGIGIDPDAAPHTAQDFLRWQTGEEKKNINEVLQRVQPDQPCFEYDYCIRIPDGNVRWFLVRGAIIYGGQGEVQGACGTTIDITERKEAEEKRAGLILSLEQALRELRTLQGLLTICTHCKRVKREEGAWDPIEVYVRDRSAVDFSHTICQECFISHYPSAEAAKGRTQGQSK